MSRYTLWTLPARVALLAAALAASGAGYWGIRALDIELLPAPEDTRASPLAVSAATLAPADDRAVAIALDNDPFSPTRRRAAERFPVPGDVPVAMAGASAVAPAADRPRLVGVVVVTDGRRYAVAELPGGAPRTVRPGERIGTYILRQVTPDEALFEGDDGERLRLRVSRQDTTP